MISLLIFIRIARKKKVSLVGHQEGLQTLKSTFLSEPLGKALLAQINQIVGLLGK